MMAAEPRYRVSPTIGTLALIEKRWAVYDTQRSAGTGWANIVCSCDAAADANLIAAALNAAEDAGRWKVALERLIPKVEAYTRGRGLVGADLLQAVNDARDALKAPEPKEAMT